MKRPHFTRMYARYRIRDPRRFVRSSFRTHDIGRSGHSKRLAGRLKSNGNWATQSILIAKKDYRKGYRVKKRYGRPIIYIKK